MKSHDGKKIENDQHFFVMEKTVNKNGVSSTKLFSRNICHKEFNREPNLKRHLKLVHPLNGTERKIIEVSCEHCSKIFPSFDELMNHLQIVKKKEENRKTFMAKKQ